MDIDCMLLDHMRLDHMLLDHMRLVGIIGTYQHKDQTICSCERVFQRLWKKRSKISGQAGQRKRIA